VWGTSISQSWSQVTGVGVAAWRLTHTVTGAVFGPPLAALLEALTCLYQSCVPVLQVSEARHSTPQFLLPQQYSYQLIQPPLP